MHGKGSRSSNMRMLGVMMFSLIWWVFANKKVKIILWSSAIFLSFLQPYFILHFSNMEALVKVCFLPLGNAAVSIWEVSYAFRKHVIFYNPVLAHHCPFLNVLCIYCPVADKASCLPNAQYLLYLDGMVLDHVNLAKLKLLFPNSFLYDFGEGFTRK